MLRLALIALALLAAPACGISQEEACPVGADLRPWVYPAGSVALSQCNRVAEVVNRSGSREPYLGRSLQTKAATVTLSARFELLSGVGQFRVFAGQGMGPIVHREDSGFLSITGAVVEGFAGLSVQGIPDGAVPLRWRVSEVQIEESP